MYTVNQLSTMFPTTKIGIINTYIEFINKTADIYDITTLYRRSAFIAQIGHESQYLKRANENLNYSKDGLKKTFPKYFTTNDLASAYARQPEKIANRVYANRMGNGDESSGDGWKFHGRGLIQITGKYMYDLFAADMELTLNEAVEYMETPEGATVSAGWYWDYKKLNPLADVEDTVNITKKINGGLTGLNERKKLYELAKYVLA